MSSSLGERSAVEYATVIDDISELLNRAYSAANVGKMVEEPGLRYKLLALLLKGFGEYSPGINIEKTKAEIKNYIGDEAYKTVDTCAGELKGHLSKIGFNPTYTAVSYWSPIDAQRHTITHRRNIQSPEEKRFVLAYAYAFYALTHFGSKKEYYSVIQYTSEHAPRKKGVPVCYKKETGEILWNKWHIHEDVHKLILEETGVASAIHTALIENDRRSDEEIEHLLGLALANIKEAPWVDIDRFAETFINKFQQLQEFSEEVRNVAIETQTYLGDFFGKEITFEQALFMLMTHLVYKEACPANYIQTYTTRVAQTCCAATIGTEEPLNELQKMAFGQLMNAIFTPPLLLDYAAQEANARLQAERNAAWRRTAFLVAHKFGNTLFPIENFLHSLQVRLNQNRLPEALEKVDDIKASIKKGKDIVYRFKRLKTIHMIDRVSTSLLPILNEACEPAKEQGFDCEVKCPTDVMVLGDAISLGECFGELVKNSIRWCHEEHPRIEIEVSQPDQNNVLIHFRDNGPGIAKEHKSIIFREFYTTYKHGSGMGLADAKHIVEAHAGKISETGQLGNGVDFVIYLPQANSLAEVNGDTKQTEMENEKNDGYG